MTSSTLPAAPDGPGNPLLADWTTPDAAPPFDRIKPEHFREAYARALADHEAEIAAITADPAPPSFDNTIAALELAGQTLARVGDVFHLLTGAHSNDALLEIEREMSPQMARHWNKINTNAALFGRVDTLMRGIDTLGLDAEQQRVLERYHTGFRRAGAGLDDPAKKRLSEIIERLATFGTTFSQNVLADEQAYTLSVAGEAELAGLPDFMREAMKSEAQERELGGHVVTLSRSSVEPFLQFSQRRDLREKMFRAFAMRGDNGGATDNKAIIAEMVRLRAERAKLLGFSDFAHYRLDDAMAKTPAAVRDLLDTVWARARQKALADRDAMQALVAEDGGNFKLAAWDWRYYAEKLRQRPCDFDEMTIKPYLNLDRMIEAAFYTAQRLFGLTFSPRPDVPVWHPDVRVWQVRDRDGKEVGLFFGDYFARPSKRSGAWMTSLRDQEKLSGDIRPQIINVCNFVKAPTASRRCSASTTRARCSTNSATRCTACCPTSPIRGFPAPASPPISSSCRRSSTSTGWSSRRCCGASRGITRPASRCRRNCCSGCSPRAISTRALPRSNTSPPPWSISISIRCRRPRRSMPTRSRKNRWRASACRTRS